MALYRPGSKDSGERPTLFLVTMVLAAGLGVSFAAFVVAWQWERHAASDEFSQQFHHEALLAFEATQKRLEVALDLLRSFDALYASSDEVTRDDFNAFASRMLPIHAGIESVTWAPRIGHAERHRFVADARASLPGFQITELTAEGTLRRAVPREEYYPTLLIEPHEDNKTILGLDHGADPIHRAALERARDTATLTFSAPTVLQAETTPEKGFSVYLPVYDKGFPIELVEQRKQHLLGFLVSSSRSAAVVVSDAGSAKRTTVNLRLIDTTISDKPQLLFRSASRPSVLSTNFVRTESDAAELRRVLEVGGREWTLIASPAFSSPDVPASALTKLLLLAGMAITGLFGWHLRTLQIHGMELRQANLSLSREVEERQRVEAAVKSSEMRLLKILELAPDAILISDRSGKILLTNSQAGDLFGFRKKDLLNMEIEQLIPEPLRVKHEKLRKDYQLGKHARPMGGGMELLAQNKNGLVFPVEISLGTVDLGSEQVVIAIVRDISARMEAEAELRRLNRTHAVLSRCTRILAETDNEDDLLQAFCNNIVALGGYCQAVVGYYAAGGTDGIQLKARVNKTGSLLSIENADQFIKTQLAAMGDEPLIRRGIQPLPVPGEPSQCHALVALPLRIEGKPFGSFGIFSSNDNAFSNNEIQLLLELAENLSIGVATMRGRVSHQQMIRVLREETEEAERKRIAALLHDDVGQSVQAVNLKLKQLRSMGSDHLFLQEDPLEQISIEIKRIITALRELSHELRPPFLQYMTLRDAIRYHCSELNAAGNVGIHFCYSRKNPELSERVKMQCFLCVREAIKNAMTHAKASRIDVTFDVTTDETLCLGISDDGVSMGPDVFEVPSGLGLLMIRERAEGLGGRVEIISDPDQGTAVSLVLPLAPPPVAANPHHIGFNG